MASSVKILSGSTLGISITQDPLDLFLAVRRVSSVISTTRLRVVHL